MIACSLITILVVDDFQGWISKVREILQERPEWKIVAEATNGPDAVRKATELRPDVILLDLGLPGLNGIDAARVIRQASPHSRIVFLTENRDADVVSAALSIGQSSYVFKSRAATGLLDTITAAVTDLRTADAQG